MVLNKWFLALLQFAVAVIAGLQVIRVDGVTTVEGWQFAAVVVSTVGVVFLPLLKNGYHAAVKVAVALAGAGVASVITIVNEAWTFDSYLIVGLAVLNAAIAHYGVQAREDGVAAVLADPDQSDAKAVAVDPVMVAIVESRGGPGVRLH